MKLFVATEAGSDEEDFAGTVPGELVHFPVALCDCPDCGCERSMAGLVSHRATTCFTVRDFDLDLTAFGDLLWDSLLQGGWVQPRDEEDLRWVRAWAVEHVAAAAGFPVDAPLQFQRHTISVRLALGTR